MGHWHAHSDPPAPLRLWSRWDVRVRMAVMLAAIVAVVLCSRLLFGVLVIGAVGVMVAIGFESTWERFHELAFTNDLWLLNPRTDHLIQMFPEPFWQDMTFVAPEP